MLTTSRRPIWSANAKEPVALFDYSEEEWSEIEAALQVLRKEILPKTTRKELAGLARWYLAERAYPGRSEMQRAWRKVALLADRLQQVIVGMAEAHVELLRKAGYATRSQESVYRENYREDVSALSRIIDNAQLSIKLYTRSSTDDAHYDNPKLMYEFKVLSTWTELGGELRVSRHPKKGKIQGPLARFFRAVTVPVMGTSAPSPESLPDIVRRQKRFVASEEMTVELFALTYPDLAKTIGPRKKL